MDSYELGRKGEIVSQKYLEKEGYFVMARNFKCAYGEIDIIAVDKQELVFIEVKTRCNRKYGEPCEAVDRIKKKHIKKASMYYISKYHLEDKFIRFDVIEAYFKDKKFYIKHIKNTLW